MLLCPAVPVVPAALSFTSEDRPYKAAGHTTQARPASAWLSEHRCLNLQDFPEGVARQISITGRPDAVQRAVSMVSELIQGEPGSAQAIIQKVP